MDVDRVVGFLAALGFSLVAVDTGEVVGLQTSFSAEGDADTAPGQAAASETPKPPTGRSKTAKGG